MKFFQKISATIPYVLILIACVLSVLTLFLCGNLYPHDIGIHLRWSKGFWEVLRNGVFYPRWLPQLNGGLGSPVFFFYPPIPYYFSSFFYWIFEPWLKNQWLPLLMSSWLARFLSGVFMYIWLRTYNEKNASLFSAIIYMIIPYHLAIDYGYRFAYGELWTFCWLPLILFFVKKISGKKYIYLIGLAVSYTALIMSHPPSVVIFSIVPLGYSVLESEDKNRTKTCLLIAAGMLIGVMLSSIYLLPALFTRENISVEKMITGSYFYMNNFLVTGPIIGHSKRLWNYILEISGFCCVLGCTLWLFFWRKLSSIDRYRSSFWLVVLLVSFYMCTPLSKPIWVLFPVLRYIQFPWRFNVLISLALPVLLALCFYQKKNTKAISLFSYERHWLPLLLILGAVLILNIAVYSVTPTNINFFNKNLMKNFNFSGMDPPEYKPRGVNNPQELIEQYSGTPQAMILEGKGKVIIETWESRKIRVITNGKTALTLLIKQYHYDGWVAEICGQNGLSEKKEKNDLLRSDGLIQIQVPAGKQQITFQLAQGIEEKSGKIISLITTIALLAFLIYLHVKPKTRTQLFKTTKIQDASSQAYRPF